MEKVTCCEKWCKKLSDEKNIYEQFRTDRQTIGELRHQSQAWTKVLNVTNYPRYKNIHLQLKFYPR